MEQEPGETFVGTDERQARSVVAGAEPPVVTANGQESATPPGPPNVVAESLPVSEEAEPAPLAVEALLDLAPPGPAFAEMAPQPVLAESFPEAAASSEPPSASTPELEHEPLLMLRVEPSPIPEPEPFPSLQGERLTPPLVGSDTPLLAAPEAVVLDAPTPAVEVDAPAMVLREEPGLATATEVAGPVPELDVVTEAAAVAVGVPVPEETTRLAGEFSPVGEVREPAPTEFEPDTEYEAEKESQREPEMVFETGPNWMLAFVTAWAGATSLYEGWVLTAPVLKFSVVFSAAFLGYAILGLGMLGFAVEAVRPLRGRIGWRVALLAPALLTLLGIALLLLSHTPGRRI